MSAPRAPRPHHVTVSLRDGAPHAVVVHSENAHRGSEVVTVLDLTQVEALIVDLQAAAVLLARAQYAPTADRDDTEPRTDCTTSGLCDHPEPDVPDTNAADWERTVDWDVVYRLGGSQVDRYKERLADVERAALDAAEAKP